MASADLTEKAAQSVSETAFDLAIQPTGEYRAEQLGRVQVVLVAKDPYKVNPEFPLAFKLHEGKGIKYPASLLGKDGAKFEPKRVTLPVDFTPEGTGKRTIAGALRFSVCNDQRCLVDKRELEITVQVK